MKLTSAIPQILIFLLIAFIVLKAYIPARKYADQILSGEKAYTLPEFIKEVRTSLLLFIALLIIAMLL